MKTITSFLLLLPVLLSYGQVSTVDSLPKTNLNWYYKSPKKDKILGVEVQRAYDELLKNKTPKKTIIVAIIDGGVDITHEDLQQRIWVNKDEIPNNKKDDDNNGYIDDVYGWNFLGNPSGENINDENTEVTRIVRKFSPKFEGKSEKDISTEDKEMFNLYVKALAEYTKNKEKHQAKYDKYQALKDKFISAEKALKKELSKETLTIEDVENYATEDSTMLSYKNTLTGLYTRGITQERLEKIVDYFSSYVNYYVNLEFNPRASISGDDVYDVNDRKYGNSDVKGPDSGHGSMVAGLIGGVRNNGIGINGIADSVRFMVLRTIPNGDEHDKDVALAIRYAVDNGANLINMSFGKYFSPMYKEVEAAIKYASDKGVLMIKASGNNETNIDTVTHYPDYRTADGTTIGSLITVGATDQLIGKKMTATFSNYGQKHVDIYAPGVNVISTVPDSKYEMASGTSFACPVTTGVAALVWSYYPTLTAMELKNILLSTGTNYKKKKVYQPGYSSEEFIKTKFGKLSTTGSIVNAYNALQEAEKMEKK